MKKSELSDTLEVLKDICTLIIEVRTANKECSRGREEGTHCKAVLQSEPQHICNPQNSSQCQRISELHESLTPLLSASRPQSASRDLTIYIDTVASNLYLDQDARHVSPGNEDVLIERWSIRMQNIGRVEKQGAAKLLLLQAIHSHLHFSQLSAWLSSSRGHFPAKVTYRINFDEELDFKLCPDQHTFPIIGIGEDKRLVVVVHSLPRSRLHLTYSNPDAGESRSLDFGDTSTKPPDGEIRPVLKSPTLKSPASCSQQVKHKLYSELSNERVSVSNGDVCVLSAASEPFRKFEPLHDSGVFSPGKSVSKKGSPAPSPSFFLGDENSLDSDIFPGHSSSLDWCQSALPNSPTPYNSPIHSTTETPLRSTPYPWPISEMFSFTPPPRTPHSPLELTRQTTHFQPIDLQPRALTSSPTPSSSKIAEPLEALNFSPIKFDSPMKCKTLQNKSSQRRSTSLCIEEEDEETSSFIRDTSAEDIRYSWHGNQFLNKPDFKRSTSLPILSSPVMYRKTCCRSDRKINGQKVVNSNKKCLLGSFEESILKDRFSPSGTISGFKFRMSVSGLFSSPSITLPFSGNFYNLSDIYCPSPYTGCVKLDTCGTHGYLVSKQGRIQATILDPENSVIRIFLIPYDVRDMPPRNQTFVRQRIHSVADDGKKTLLYHIHFRLMSGRSSRIYLHTEIRVLFVRGTSSVNTGEAELGGGTQVTENCIPLNPRYSTISKTKRSR